MKLPSSTRALRRALKLEGLSSEQHRQEIEKLRNSHPHSIRFVESRRDQTCASYALHLTDDPTYRALAGVCDIYAGKDFMNWVEPHMTAKDQAREGLLVSYFASTEWKHVGVVIASGRITSKWGTYPLYEHDVAEVSEEYGEEIKFYERPSPAESLSLFVEFAHECGLSDAGIAEARARWRE
jgi:hypothetical protein